MGVPRCRTNAEGLVNFINDTNIWETGSLADMKSKRKEVLEVLANDTKGLSFLPQNKLTFALQKNIVKNIQTNKESKKYAPWFSLAEKTRNKN